MNKATVEENIRRIATGIDKEKYPVLYGYLNNGRSRLKADLLLMLEHMAANKATTSNSKQRMQYWAIPVSVMKQRGGSARTWQSHTVFFAVSGLLVRIKPNASTLNDTMRRAYLKAVEERKAPMAFYSCKLYTEKLLARAEETALLFKQRGISLSDIRKQDVISLYGQEYADMYYQDVRTVSKLDEWIVETMVQSIEAQISEQGYAIRDKVMWDLNRKKRERDAWEESKIQHAVRQFTSICVEHGYSYVRVRREHHERWRLTYGQKIIVKTEL